MERLKAQKFAFTLFVLTMTNALAQKGGNPGPTPPGTPGTPGPIPPPNGGTLATDPVGIFKAIGCWIVGILSSPTLVAVAGAVLLLVFGWGKMSGEMNAFTNFKNGVIGAVIVLAAAAISTALFGAGCGV